MISKHRLWALTQKYIGKKYRLNNFCARFLDSLSFGGKQPLCYSERRVEQSRSDLCSLSLSLSPSLRLGFEARPVQSGQRQKNNQATRATNAPGENGFTGTGRRSEEDARAARKKGSEKLEGLNVGEERKFESRINLTQS